MEIVEYKNMEQHAMLAQGRATNVSQGSRARHASAVTEADSVMFTVVFSQRHEEVWCDTKLDHEVHGRL